ncbi:6340_t:CDS:2 [Dentiscutata heterogama]|uniref:6340_t:CDS:1 n=1 Tax=Dentiscutata heterogama TaxID=1316150 RepID=A0ACA9KNU8_9GLOM|nr:6340_t:CDS:2 [Dentiscutata heterogama]
MYWVMNHEFDRISEVQRKSSFVVGTHPHATGWRESWKRRES